MTGGRGDRAGPILLFGATGQIGAGILAACRARGRPVIALRHRRAGPNDPNVRWIDGDLTRPPLPLEGVTAAHAIFATGLWLLPAHLDRLAQAGLRRLVAFSTTSVIAKRDTRSRRERALVGDIAEAEGLVRTRCDRLGIGWTLLRPTLAYGRGLDRNITAAARFIERFGVYPIAGLARGLREPVHADDLAAAALAALDREAAIGRIYHLGGGERLSYREMIGRIFDCLDRPRRLIRVPMLGPLAGLWGRVSGNPALTAESVRRMNQDLVFSDRAARRDLDYAPRAFLTGGRADLGL